MTKSKSLSSTAKRQRVVHTKKAAAARTATVRSSTGRVMAKGKARLSR